MSLAFSQRSFHTYDVDNLKIKAFKKEWFKVKKIVHSPA
jgi:hypothetical protein